MSFGISGVNEVADDDGPPDEVDAGEMSLLQEEEAMRERLRVDPNAIDDDLSRAASDLAYAGGRFGRATLAHLRAKIGTKKIRAVAYMQSKERALDTYGSTRSGATNDVVNALVDQDEDYLAAAEHEAVAEATLALAKTNVDAAKARKDMLVQVASKLRAEMEMEPSFRRRVGNRPESE